MNKFDIAFAFICGIFVAWLASDFIDAKYLLFLYSFLPVFSVLCLWLAEIVSSKLLFINQAAKFVLVGGFADIIDIKAFQLLFWLLPMSLFAKSVSFLIAVAIKYVGNRLWTFDKTLKNKENQIKEITQFLIVTLGGLLINVFVFYCATRLIEPMFGILPQIWMELSIILAALVTAIWNFLGYKFVVFKN